MIDALNQSNTYREIQAVFFDAAGTLFEVRESVGKVYSRLARRFDCNLESTILQERFTGAFRLQPPLAFPNAAHEAELHQSEYEWWRKLARDVFAGLEFPRFDEFFAELFEFYRDSKAWRLFDDVEPALEALDAHQLRLAIISNFDSRIEDLLRAFKLDRYFHAVHISSRIGAAKPDPIIFHAALRHNGIEGHQALHVGDDLREDVEGAAAAGMMSVLIDRHHALADDPRVPRITSLNQIVELISRGKG
jgi:putative hydrolase of the HAD superfamily